MAADIATAAVSLADDALKVGLQLQAEENTPAQVQAKQARQLQTHKDAVLALVDAAEAGNTSALAALRVLCASLAILCALVGCTIAPPIVTPGGPSLDSGVANSGILAAGTNGFLVTPFFAERYTNLCQRFGDRLVPPMPTPRWIVPEGTNFLVTAQGLAAFEEMNLRWHQTLNP